MPRRLMCLTAHPDDEAGAFGAALLLAAEQGIETSVVCLTEGAAGSYRQEGQTDEELAASRREEFVDACHALAIDEARLLKYPDGQLWEQPFLSLVGVFVEGIRRFRPHVVLTFGGEGGVNLHRDHTTVSLAATAAFHWAGRSGFFAEQLETLPIWAPQKLYYAATQFLSTRDEEAQRGGTMPPVSLSLHLDDALMERKLAVFGKHTSQRGVIERVRAQFGDQMNREDYHLVATRTPVTGVEEDFWGGVVLDA
ncbi:PIG-L deacetylase family protein [Acidipila sp. EB88]|uniref:PIG-L deacetylase family protein n=1 Tax=Acidipila sp. EB88 TaxID=2305226 RepID=UPI001315290E|nr:PIG-L family deacetylase [Acidipila sp. EB88]